MAKRRGPNPSYKYVIFDYDGCLADSITPWIAAIRKASKEFGFSFTNEQINHHMSEFMRVMDFGLSKSEAIRYRERVWELGSAKALRASLHVGAKELLFKLKENGVKLAIVSSNSVGLERALKHNGIEGLFTAVITGRDVAAKKPDPEGVEKAISMMEGEKGKTVIVGDSSHDLLAGRNAGIDYVLFAPPNQTPLVEIRELARLKPKRVVRSHQELSEFLNPA